MNGSVILADDHDRLAELVRGRSGRNPVPTPFEVSPWIALSLLQKSIRRGRAELALRAAATLLRDAPDRLWRRLLLIATEDVGLGDMGTLSLATAATSGKASRRALGGEWAVAAPLIERMACARKCRAADDLCMIVQHHPGLATARLDYADLELPELLRIALSDNGLPERALATWLSIGTRSCPSDHLPMTKGDPDGVFGAFCDAGLPDTMVEVSRIGFRRTRHVICPFVSLMSQLPGRVASGNASDDLTPDDTVRGIPAWSFDMFVREGRKAMTIFLSGDTQTAGWIRRHLPTRDRIGFLGNILFAVEGGLLKYRLDWQTGRDLRRSAEVESQGPHCRDATEILALMQSDLTFLNRVRADVC